MLFLAAKKLSPGVLNSGKTFSPFKGCVEIESASWQPSRIVHRGDVTVAAKHLR
jgi:hypothetical protein